MASERKHTKSSEIMPNPHPSLIEYTWHMKKNGRTESTIETVTKRLTLLAKHCNIQEPEQVKETLANLHWKNSTKITAIGDYSAYLRFLGKTWTKPKYQRESTLVFIPTEQELDTLISAGQPKTATRQQILKETGARIGELDKLEWTHIDTQRKTIYITAEKGSNSRILPISTKLIAMLNQLPKTNNKIFKVSKHGFRKTFEALRNKTAQKLDNPRLLKIHLHTFRHWKGTTEYHKTKDIIHVKTMLGHKDIQSTMRYINLEQAIYIEQNDQYTVKIAHNITEATQLLEIGFEYITEMDGTKLFRKRR